MLSIFVRLTAAEVIPDREQLRPQRGRVRRVLLRPTAAVAFAVAFAAGGGEHRQDLGRLVPLDLVDGAAGKIRLRCTIAEFEKLGSALEAHFTGAGSFGLDDGRDLGDGTTAQLGLRDAVPPGEVGVRRGEPVHATDGDIGRIQGIVIDAGSRHVTHVLLQKGHLWSRRAVAIPIGAVASTGDGIRLSITRQQVEDLPPADIDGPD